MSRSTQLYCVVATLCLSSIMAAANAQAPVDQASPQAKSTKPVVPGSPAETLSDKLSQTNGTVQPPSTKDSGMIKPTPATNDAMPVITKPPPAGGTTTTPPSAGPQIAPPPK